MNEVVAQPLVLKKKSKSSRFASWKSEGNSFVDKLLRSVYIFLLFAINFVMFIYSVNGKVFEGGVANQAVLAILGAFFVFSFVLIMLCSFSKMVQNGLCALLTMIFVAVFYYQFAVFDANNFVETWLNKKASWLTFICFVPSAWIIGFLIGLVVFFLFISSFGVMFVTLVLLSGFVLGIQKNEAIKSNQEEYSVIKELPRNSGNKREGNIVYFMVPKFPSYQFLGSIRNTHFRELRNLMIGFYATNDFEIYPNAFVENKGTMDNIVDIINMVDYSSTTSNNRGFSEYDNEWNFIHGGLNLIGLDEKRLYDDLNKKGYGVSVYAMPEFNICMIDGTIESDRCVIKGYKTVELFDKNASLEQNVFSLLTEWVINLKRRDLKGVAKMLVNKSAIKGFKVTSENRRVSIEGAPHLFDVLADNVVKDTGGQVYLVYVDLPSDIFIYDEYCNIKPRKDWIALKDNSFVNGGIDEKREAYVEQTKCLIGKMQEFMDVLKESGKLSRTDVFVQGVSTISELADMKGGTYSNFVVDKLVSMGIRKAKKTKFLINANICLASDFTKSLIKYQDYCYSIDNMKMGGNEGMSLKKNLINNSVIRGGKITSIAVNYRDWYEEFKKNSLDYQQKVYKINEEKMKQQRAEEEKVERERQKKEREEAYHRARTENISQDNIFVPTDDGSEGHENIVEIDDIEKENVNVEGENKVQGEVKVEDKTEAKEVVNVDETLNVEGENKAQGEVKVEDKDSKKESLEQKHLETIADGGRGVEPEGLGEIDNVRADEVVEILSQEGNSDIQGEVKQLKEVVDVVVENEDMVSDDEKKLVGEAVAEIEKNVSKEEVKAFLEEVGGDDEGIKNVKEYLEQTPEDREQKEIEQKVLNELEKKQEESENVVNNLEEEEVDLDIF